MSSAKIMSAVNKALDKIGSTKETRIDIPENSNAPAETVAYELLISGSMRSYAEGRYKAAKEAAEAAGVLGSGDIQEDTTAVVYDGPSVVVTRKVNKAPNKFDSTKFISELRKAGVKAEIIEAAEKVATKKGTPAKIYTAMLRETGEE